ncbi:hypothetical protein F0562_036001 [Nyssa sinensis]|uniref:Uncharacterized protein n=1 Tax=Nyssa sinensis TaxID=561372 RepID=A0A5J5AG06_9ASTE|nr:hypothetical protein F0562_036001 [Nyssa sinensis]
MIILVGNSLQIAILILWTRTWMKFGGCSVPLLRIVFRKNSFVTLQASTGVEVCTFWLILKNASLWLDDIDPIKLEAEADLSELIRSFTSLNGMANEADIQLPAERE